MQILRDRVHDRRAWAVVGVVVLAVLATAIGFRTAPSSTVAAKATLSVISGEVLVETVGGRSRVGQDREAITAGVTVQARAPDGRAVLTIADGSTQELEPGASVAIDELSIGSRGELVVRLRQERGRTWSHVQPLLSPSSRFHVATPSVTAVARGTSFEIDVAGVNGQIVTKVSVFQGLVDLVAAGAVRPLTASQASEVVAGSPPQAPKQITLPPVCVRMELSSAAMMTVTDPGGRSAGQMPLGAVSQIPATILTGPQTVPQSIDIFSPQAGEWEIGIVARGDGGAFQLVVDTAVGGRRAASSVVASTIQPGQRLVTRIHVEEGGQADGLSALEQTTRTKANVALPGHGTTTAPLPRARTFSPVADPLALSCGGR